MANDSGKGFFAGLFDRFKKPGPKQEEKSPQKNGAEKIKPGETRISDNTETPDTADKPQALPDKQKQTESGGNFLERLTSSFLKKEKTTPHPEEEPEQAAAVSPKPIPEPEQAAAVSPKPIPEPEQAAAVSPKPIPEPEQAAAVLQKPTGETKPADKTSEKTKVPPLEIETVVEAKKEPTPKVPKTEHETTIETISEPKPDREKPAREEHVREEPVGDKSILNQLKPSFLKKEEPVPEPAGDQQEQADEPSGKKGGIFGGGWFKRLKEGLDKTRKSFVFKVKGLLRLRNVIDEEFWEELEDILITADVGLKTTDYIVTRMQEKVEEKLISEPSHLFQVMKDELCLVMERDDTSLRFNKDGLSVIMVVGVNGTGKTTSIAKLANRLMQQDKKVIVAAADTFRAAAIEQLEVWSTKLGLDIIKHKEGADPAAVVFDGVEAAKARGADVLIVDTAGRLHSKVNLMKELEKIKRVIEKQCPGALTDNLLVLDATTGQNALIQAKTFSNFVELSGIILTKLDGTAKGGVIIGIVHELGIPVKFIGIGEGVYDLRPFDSRDFLEALFSDNGQDSQE